MAAFPQRLRRPSRQHHGSGHAGSTCGVGPALDCPSPANGYSGEPLRLEIESFLSAVRTRREPRVTARQGRDALALALEIQAAMAAHAHRAGLQDFLSRRLKRTAAQRSPGPGL